MVRFFLIWFLFFKIFNIWLSMKGFKIPLFSLELLDCRTSRYRFSFEIVGSFGEQLEKYAERNNLNVEP